MTLHNKFYNEIKKINGIKVYCDANLKHDNNMRIEAKCAYKIEVYDYIKLKDIFPIIDKYGYEYRILGMGSNILFVKEYYDLVFIKLMPRDSSYLNIVMAGSSLNCVNFKLVKEGIDSLNFLTGVPCSIGGAIYMNAGSFNKEIKDIIEYVYYFDLGEFKFKVKSKDECHFSYRGSIFKDKNMLIVGAKVVLNYGDINKIITKHHEYLNERSKKLPLESPNLGSIFKNPNDLFAGKIIDELGLKGLSYKGAMISEKHANVIVNFNNAKGDSVLKLIEIIESLVYIKYKIELEREIIIFK